MIVIFLSEVVSRVSCCVTMRAVDDMRPADSGCVVWELGGEVPSCLFVRGYQCLKAHVCTWARSEERKLPCEMSGQQNPAPRRARFRRVNATDGKAPVIKRHAHGSRPRSPGSARPLPLPLPPAPTRPSGRVRLRSTVHGPCRGLRANASVILRQAWNWNLEVLDLDLERRRYCTLQLTQGHRVCVW